MAGAEVGERVEVERIVEGKWLVCEVLEVEELVERDVEERDVDEVDVELLVELVDRDVLWVDVEVGEGVATADTRKLSILILCVSSRPTVACTLRISTVWVAEGLRLVWLHTLPTVALGEYRE